MWRWGEKRHLARGPRYGGRYGDWGRYGGDMAATPRRGRGEIWELGEMWGASGHLGHEGAGDMRYGGAWGRYGALPGAVASLRA